MLSLAIKAQLPLITVQSDDPVNVGAIIAAVAGKATAPYSPSLKSPITKGGLYYCPHSDSLNYKELYSRMAKYKAVLCIVNPPGEQPSAFNAGVVTTPPSMIKAFVAKYGGTKHQAALVAALSGLSFKEVVETTKLAMAKHGEYTARAVRDIRQTRFGYVRGLQMVSTDFLYYLPATPLQNWLVESGRFLTEYDIPLLRPRGLLFNGKPGTGKTMGAKYLAKELDVPLYRLDIGTVMSKYVGESEQNLQLALKQAEQCAPCVILIDEVEKLFTTGSDDSGVTSRLLSSILWWLQEHRSSVMTIMTTNKSTSIPPELYREGRIDSEIYFNLLDEDEAMKFAKELADKMSFIMKLDLSDVKFTGQFSHAHVTEIVRDEMKYQYLKQEGKK